MSIDLEIEKLEKQLALLKNTKNKMNQLDDEIINKKGDFKIKIFDENSNDVLKYVDTFKKLYDLWTSKMKKTDYIFLEYFDHGRYHQWEGKTYKDFIDMVKCISTLNACQITSMDFTICSRDGRFRFYVAIENEYLEWFYFSLDHTEPDTAKYYGMTQEEYWNKIDEGKKYRLSFK
jgi:hypothetical protein